MQQESSVKTIPNAQDKSIFTILDECFGANWTWELADEKFYADGTSVCTTVTVYIPGRVLTGRSMCKLKDYPSNHERAVDNACLHITEEVKICQQVSPLLDSEMAKTQNMTPEQIMESLNNMTEGFTEQPIQNTPNTPIESNIQQFPNKSINELLDNTPEDFPIYSGSETNQQVAQDINTQPAQEPLPTSPPQPQLNTQTTEYGPDDPQPRYKGFSQNQIDGINKFKSDFDVINDNMFANYVKTWNKELKDKNDIKPDNVDEFLKWIDTLGKMDC